MNPPLTRKSDHGFSLIEVTIAVGIVAFAFTALMGMIPVGLNTFENSTRSTVNTQIAQRIFSEAQQVKFENLAGLTTSGGAGKGSYFYDDEGFPVGEGATPPAGGYVYHAIINPPTSTFINNARMSTITIDISKNRKVQESTPQQIRRFSFMVADVGT